MDTGAFYGGTSSVAFSLPGSSTVPPHVATPYHDPYMSTGGHVAHAVGINQKLDQLLFMFAEQKSEAAKLKEQVAQLTTEVASLKTQQLETASVSTTCKKPKLPTDLSATVKHLHEKAAAASKFNPSEAYSSSKNQEVKTYLLRCLGEKFKGTSSPRRMKRAVHRYYESRRRLFNDEQPGRRDVAREMKVQSKKKALQRKLYNRRKSHLRSAKETELWSAIDYRYMTEESEGDDDTVHQHELPWRSRVLTSLVRKLDKRREKQQKGGHFHQKDRVKLSASTLPVPADAPEWAVGTPQAPASTPVAAPQSSSARRHLLYTPDEPDSDVSSSGSELTD